MRVAIKIRCLHLLTLIVGVALEGKVLLRSFLMSECSEFSLYRTVRGPGIAR
jgi:hypothetical protein